MIDPRIEKLADLLVNYSVEAKKNQKIKVLTSIDGLPLARAVTSKLLEAGAIPFEEIIDTEIRIDKINNLGDEQLEELRKYKNKNMEEFSGSVSIRGSSNIHDNKRISTERMQALAVALKESSNHRTNKTNWVLLNYPSPSTAQQFGMATKDYEDFLLRVCTINYAKFAEYMTPLVALINKTDKVQIKKNNGTDLTFSIKNIGATKCSGKRNIPDGEVYTAPVKDSINGTIVFNTMREYNGASIKNVEIEFKDGKAIKVKSDTDNEKFQEILNIDDGARYVGEFAFGLNPYIDIPTGDLLFDEKINGSIHFALGKCFTTSDNGNSSINHIDIVQLHRPQHGGGEIFFDDTLIMKDGDFVLDKLKALNASNLRKELS